MRQMVEEGIQGGVEGGMEGEREEWKEIRREGGESNLLNFLFSRSL